MLKLEQIKDMDLKKETLQGIEGRRWRKTRAMPLQGVHMVGAYMLL